jgi:hypothetical protein
MTPVSSQVVFILLALCDFGTAARRFFAGPGMVNFDVALQKNLALTESKSLQFRAETFNTFNYAQFFGAAGGRKYQRLQLWADRERSAAAVDASGDAIRVLTRTERWN